MTQEDIQKVKNDVVDIWNRPSTVKKIATWLKKFKNAEKLSKYIQTNHKFQPKYPLMIWVTNSGNVTLRFNGHIVALIYLGKGDIYINTEAYPINKEYGFEGKFDKPWHSKEATQFRRHYTSITSHDFKRNKEETNYESKILDKMSKGKYSNIFHARPVKTGNFFFKFPVLTNARDTVIAEGVKENTGYMDIVARKREKNHVFPVVYELKKPGKYDGAMMQVYIYALNLLKLFRSGNGNEWYKLMGINSPLPVRIKIEASVLITDDVENIAAKDKAVFTKENLVLNNDEIELTITKYKKENEHLMY